MPPRSSSTIELKSKQSSHSANSRTTVTGPLGGVESASTSFAQSTRAEAAMMSARSRMRVVPSASSSSMTWSTESSNASHHWNGTCQRAICE